MKFHLTNRRRLVHFWMLALFSWIGGQWLLVYAGWTQPWMAYSVSCAVVTQLSNLILKVLLVNNENDQANDSDEMTTKDRSANNKKKKKNKKTTGKRGATD